MDSKCFYPSDFFALTIYTLLDSQQRISHSLAYSKGCLCDPSHICTLQVPVLRWRQNHNWLPITSQWGEVRAASSPQIFLAKPSRWYCTCQLIWLRRGVFRWVSTFIEEGSGAGGMGQWGHYHLVPFFVRCTCLLLYSICCDQSRPVTTSFTVFHSAMQLATEVESALVAVQSSCWFCPVLATGL